MDKHEQDVRRLLMTVSKEQLDSLGPPTEEEIKEEFLRGKRARDVAAAASHTTAVNPKLKFRQSTGGGDAVRRAGSR